MDNWHGINWQQNSTVDEAQIAAMQETIDGINVKIQSLPANTYTDIANLQSDVSGL